MNVQLIESTPNAEDHIVHVARVSSGRADKKAKPEGLINYLIKNNHWSPFEHAYMTLEIETSKAIGIQLIRHRSFTFQEFSQRYQDVNKLDDMFEDISIRRQCDNNRQSSTEEFDPLIKHGDISISASQDIQHALRVAETTYNNLINAGVAREQARMVLPLATKTKIYMTGSIRSWVHFLQLRDDEHAQLEIQLIARDAKSIFVNEFPMISNALNYPI